MNATLSTLSAEHRTAQRKNTEYFSYRYLRIFVLKELVSQILNKQILQGNIDFSNKLNELEMQKYIFYTLGNSEMHLRCLKGALIACY